MGRLHLHALAYGLLLAVVAVVIPLDASFGSDDGAYGGQVYALRQGAWTLDRPAAVVPEANEGWLNTAITPDGPTPYTANPAYSRLLQGVVRVVHGPADPAGGERGADLALGLHLPGLVAALASACLAWLLAARWDRRAGPMAFWLLGLGPVLVDTTALWAHPLSTATGGLALLAAVALLQAREVRPAGGPTAAGTGRASARWMPPARWAMTLTAALAAGAALRSEALFWTAAVLVSVLVVDRSRMVNAVVATSATAAATVWGLNRWWGRELRADRLPVETSVAVLEGSGSWAATRIPAAWQLLGTSLSATTGTILVLMATTAVLVAGLRLRRRQPEQATGAITCLLVVAAALYGAKAILEPDRVIPGVVSAWPLMALALVAGTTRAPADRPHPVRTAATPPPARLLLLPCALLLGAVLVTQYANSGGLQWGGRYLSMGYVPAASAASLGLRAMVPSKDHGGDPARRLRLAALAALAVVPAATGLMVSHRLHTNHAAIVATVTAEPADVVITDISALTRIAWPALPTAFYRADATTIEVLLEHLARAGVGAVNVQGSQELDLDGIAGYRLTSPAGTVRHLTLDPALRPSPAVPDAGP